VEKIIYIPIDWLQNTANSHYELYEGKSNVHHHALFYSNYDGEIVWGVTASLVRDLFQEIK